MANEEQLKILKAGVDVWNNWRIQKHNTKVDLVKADLSNTDLNGINFSGFKTGDVNLREVNLKCANLKNSNLNNAYLDSADLGSANLYKANLNGACLSNTDLRYANLSESNIRGAEIRHAKLNGAQLIEVDLSYTDFSGSDLSEANLNRANLRGSDLSHTNLTLANISDAVISESKIYGVNVWDLKGEFTEQKELIITPSGESAITVDNIKVAQFVYLILNNKEIRDVINTLTSKTVLILGRFALPERKAILDTLRNKLREYDLLPIVFDFDRPTDKDFTETIKTLAGISYFVIADITNPKSSPLELQATVPDYQIPFVPIIQEGEFPFSMMVDLQKKYSWVLDTIAYDSSDTLINILKSHIVNPAIKKRDELRIIKASLPTIISGKNLVSGT